MGKEESRVGKDLAFDQKKIEEIVEMINTAILNNKSQVALNDGKSSINIDIAESSEKKGEYSIEFGGKKIATVKKGEKVPSEKVRLEMQRYREIFNFNKMDENLGRTPLARERSDPRSLKFEAELKQAIQEGRATKLRDGREITAAGEDLSLIMKRMFGERAHEVYRVRDKNDPNKFTYIGKGTDGRYFEPRGSRTNEGHAPRQICWVQNTDGTFEKKSVEDMKVFGKYALATDIADNHLSDHTRTLVGVRTTRGAYIFMPALDHRIADTASNPNVKDSIARGNSVWEIDDIVLAAELAETIKGVKKDGKMTADEIEFIRKLKKEGLEDDKIRKIVNAVMIVGELKEQGLNDASIKAILDTVESVSEQMEELKKEGFNDKEIKEVMDLTYKDEVRFEDAKGKVLKEKDKKEQHKDQKTMYDVQDDEEEYVGYGQKRPRP